MKYITFCAIILVSVLSACIKEYQGVESPSFDVQTDSLVYKVNQPIKFKVTGNADRVTFYSGESGHNYDYKNRVTVKGKAQIQFSTVRQYGAGAGQADTTLKILISKNFSGEPNAVDIYRAKWIDISDRATFSTGINTARVPSGAIDISDLTNGDSAIYVAFKYHEQKTSQTKRAWYTYDFKINNILEDNSVVPVAKWADMAFAPVNVLNPLRSWFVYADYSLMWGGNADYPETEDWLVSKPLFINRVNRDSGVSIRNNPKALLTDYEFSGFAKPGTYTVVFEAYNATQWETKQILKKITLTIK